MCLREYKRARRWNGLAAEEGAHRRDDFIELRLRQLGKDRQREHLGRGLLALRALTLAVAEVGEAGLKVQRQRVVDGGPDAALLEERLQCVAARYANGVLVEDRLVLRTHHRRPHVAQIA